ncbi:unnamed protein product [Sphagnum balticum]
MCCNEADKVAKELRSTLMTLTGGQFCSQEILFYFLHMCLDGMVILNFHHHFPCTIGPIMGDSEAVSNLFWMLCGEILFQCSPGA